MTASASLLMRTNCWVNLCKWYWVLNCCCINLVSRFSYKVYFIFSKLFSLLVKHILMVRWCFCLMLMILIALFFSSVSENRLPILTMCHVMTTTLKSESKRIRMREKLALLQKWRHKFIRAKCWIFIKISCSKQAAFACVGWECMRKIKRKLMF